MLWATVIQGMSHSPQLSALIFLSYLYFIGERKIDYYDGVIWVLMSQGKVINNTL